MYTTNGDPRIHATPNDDADNARAILTFLRERFSSTGLNGPACRECMAVSLLAALDGLVAEVQAAALTAVRYPTREPYDPATGSDSAGLARVADDMANLGEKWTHSLLLAALAFSAQAAIQGLEPTGRPVERQ
jgi:hypothetical protein